MTSCNLTAVEDLAVRVAYVRALNSTVKLSDVGVSSVTCNGEVLQKSSRHLAESRPAITASWELYVVLNLVDYPSAGNDPALLLSIITKQTSSSVLSAAFSEELRASASEYGSSTLSNSVVEGAAVELVSVTPVDTSSPTAAPVQPGDSSSLSVTGIARRAIMGEWYYLLTVAIFASALFCAVGYFNVSARKEAPDDDRSGNGSDNGNGYIHDNNSSSGSSGNAETADWATPELSGDVDADLDSFFANLMQFPSGDAPSGEGGLSSALQTKYSWAEHADEARTPSVCSRESFHSDDSDKDSSWLKSSARHPSSFVAVGSPHPHDPPRARDPVFDGCIRFLVDVAAGGNKTSPLRRKSDVFRKEEACATPAPAAQKPEAGDFDKIYGDSAATEVEESWVGAKPKRPRERGAKVREVGKFFGSWSSQTEKVARRVASLETTAAEMTNPMSWR